MTAELKFEELQKKLKKVLDTNRFRFIFIFYPHINLRENIKNYICENFIHSNSLTLDLKNNTYQDIAPILYENDKSFIFIDDFFDVLYNADLYNGFNQRRDKIASKNINLICFVNSNFKEKFFHTSIEYIPDLFEFKNAIFEIEIPNNDENKLKLNEISSSSYSSLGGLTTESKKDELDRLILKLENTSSDDEKINLYDQISTIFKDIGKYEKALEYLEKTLKIEEDDLSLAVTYNNISIIYQNIKNFQKALEYQKKSIEIKEKFLDKNDSELASSYNNLATIYMDIYNYEKALEYSKIAINILENIQNSNYDLAMAYNNISILYRRINSFQKSLEYAKKAIQIQEEIWEDKHPDLATSYNNISVLYQDIGEIPKALEYVKKAIKIQEEMFGDKHPDLATSYSNISIIYINLKECINAKEYMQKAIDIWQQYEYHNKELSNSRKIIKDIEHNIKQEKKLPYNKKGRFCKDV
ncbi:tetratricopeptide repeat protein [Arcobacter cloacae]|uniref:Tetratricopeptide repeat protein n=1 Tax=Arcobacter cloacae TaxID=1054034 RepID=A0A6M8NHP8_9BACT|nr:tetratricopeptide repeat protein [Arcobacter cloacae]QKF89251.1 tetratricopeptide repeat protein [Arcobacter cloacae]RXI42607.1 tetratricopeptide repeat protein [Arcobacter cloacae]